MKISVLPFAAILIASGTIVFAWQSSTLPEPAREAGSSVTGAFEGWFKNSDGTFLLLGYYNRNQVQEMEIPIGPNNRIEPGGPDRSGGFHLESGGTVLVFSVTPTKILAFAKGTFSVTRHQF